jgi:hypothetical protein
MYHGILGALQGSEERLARTLFNEDAQGLKIPVTQGDVGYLVEEVYNGRSVISDLSTRLVLTRWKKPKTNFMDKRTPGQTNSLLRMNELVLMTKEEATKHEKKVLKGDKRLKEVYDADILEKVSKLMEEEERYERFR